MFSSILAVGELLGVFEGEAVGVLEGLLEGAAVGEAVGAAVGRLLGLLDGSAVGAGSSSIVTEGLCPQPVPFSGSARTVVVITMGPCEHTSNLTDSLTEELWSTSRGFDGRGSKDVGPLPVTVLLAVITVKLSEPVLVIDTLTVASRVQDLSPHDRSCNEPYFSFNRSGPDILIRFVCKGIPVESSMLQRTVEGSSAPLVPIMAKLSPVLTTDG